MAYDIYSIQNAPLFLAGTVAPATTLSGSLYVSYDPATGAPVAVTGNLSANLGTLGVVQFSGYTIASSTTNGVTTYTVTANGAAGAANLSISYIGQNPGSANVSVSALAVGGTATNAAAQTVTQLDVACFAAGTLISTSRGEVAVENLRVGDSVVTTSGTSRPIVWLGNSDIDIRLQAHPIAYQPIRIATDAFGSGMPYRDLTVSPGHGICVRMLDEVIVPPIVLVNGTTITQLDEDHVSYWHVELDAHDIMYANGLPAESYINVGNRGFFDELGDDPVRTLADYCRPYIAEGVLVTAMREQLRLRAEQLGWRCETTPFDDLHLEADGVCIEPVIDGLVARFALPADADEVWLVSSASVPAHVLGSHDTRRLGVLLRNLRIEDGSRRRDVALDDASLCVGFHTAEVSADGAQRWTAGRARLPTALWAGLEGSLAIRMELAMPPLPKWTAPVQPETKPGRDGKHLSLVAAA